MCSCVTLHVAIPVHHRNCSTVQGESRWLSHYCTPGRGHVGPRQTRHRYCRDKDDVLYHVVATMSICRHTGVFAYSFLYLYGRRWNRLQWIFFSLCAVIVSHHNKWSQLNFSWSFFWFFTDYSLTSLMDIYISFIKLNILKYKMHISFSEKLLRIFSRCTQDLH